MSNTGYFFPWKIKYVTYILSLMDKYFDMYGFNNVQLMNSSRTL